MATPTTFTKSRRHVVTIMSKAHGASLGHDLKLFCALSVARQVTTHRTACKWIIDLGLAPDEAEADALIYEAEERDDQGMLNV